MTEVDLPSSIFVFEQYDTVFHKKHVPIPPDPGVTGGSNHSTLVRPEANQKGGNESGGERDVLEFGSAFTGDNLKKVGNTWVFLLSD